MIVTNEKIRISLQIALLGEVYPEIRSIAYRYKPSKKEFTIRYYLDRQPTDEDFENVSTVMTEFLSYFPYDTFDAWKEECEYTSLPMSKVDVLDGFVYARKEYK